jgi:glycosyltransferase involved in cell wall biosynthesis
LVLIGDGKLRGRIGEQAAALGISDGVRMLGVRPDAQALLPAFDLVVLSSMHEALGRALVEAMASEVAVVGTSVGGIPEALAYGRGGLLVPPGEPEALSEAMQTLLENPTLRREFAVRGREHARNFSSDRAARSLLRAYLDA